MTVAELLASEIQYVTDEAGQKRAVQIDFAVWQQVVALLERLALLEDLEVEASDEQKWDETFANSQDLLARLADEAIAARKAGRTQPLDPDLL